MPRSGRAIFLMWFFLTACDRGARLVESEPSISEVAGRYSLSSCLFGNEVDSEIRLKAADTYSELKTNGVATVYKLPLLISVDRLASYGTYSQVEWGSVLAQ